jgi:hypothetical protein
MKQLFKDALSAGITIKTELQITARIQECHIVLDFLHP